MESSVAILYHQFNFVQGGTWIVHDFWVLSTLGPFLSQIVNKNNSYNLIQQVGKIYNLFEYFSYDVPC